MADLVTTAKQQSLAEIRLWDFDFSLDLGSGITVASATATHIPPSGSPATPTIGTIAGNVVPVRLGPLAVVGTHVLSVLATLSNAEKSEIRLSFTVPF